MEKLNEYLQALLSTCSYELHLEPNKNPFVVSTNGENDVVNSPLLGTQISMMVFPLIPADVKRQLPNSSEVEFTYSHNLGDFNFLVKKSPAGFNVTIRPVISNQPPEADFDSNKFDFPAFAQNQVSDSSAKGEFEQFGQNAREFSALNSSDFSDESNFSGFSAPGIEENQPAPLFEENIFSGSQSKTAPLAGAEYAIGFSENPAYETPEKKSDFTSLSEPNFDNDYNFQVDSQNHFDLEPKIIEDDETIHFLESDTPFPETQNIQNLPANFSAPPAQLADERQFNDQFQDLPQSPAFSAAQTNPQAKARMDALFVKMAEAGASDLHLSVSMPPMIRKDGKMRKLEDGEPALTPNVLREILNSIMPAKNREEFARRNDTDFAYEIPNLARFRANIFADRKGMGGVFRIIPSKILTAEQLGLSPAIMSLCELSKGLVVVTGPTGSGKSTTLCAMINHINERREEHIITIEDPIEFVHENQKCLVNQREVHNHTDSFKNALRAALREDPDILLVGEMRDLETISIAIETAETGHLVFGTLHTTTAASTVDRIIDQFPADRQQQIRVMLSESLKGVIAQTLLPKKGGGRVAALEVLIVTPAISNLIREGKTFQIPSAMQTGKQHGMVMLNDALLDLVQKGLVAPRDAYFKAVDKVNFEALLARSGFSI
jgi:twitching motility protein PilT